MSWLELAAAIYSISAIVALSGVIISLIVFGFLAWRDKRKLKKAVR